MAQVDNRDRLRELLLAAMAAEHRLYQAAAEEEAAGQRWEARAALAQGKEAPDLAEAARRRAADCYRRARAYRAEYRRQRARVAELKAAPQRPTPMAAAPLTASLDGLDAVARRQGAREREERLERDLAELKKQLGRL